MTIPSNKRRAELVEDKGHVERIYLVACQKWGKAQVDKDHTRVWDLRCMWGIRNILPFGSIKSTCMGDVLYVLDLVLEEQAK